MCDIHIQIQVEEFQKVMPVASQSLHYCSNIWKLRLYLSFILWQNNLVTESIKIEQTYMFTASL